MMINLFYIFITSTLSSCPTVTVQQNFNFTEYVSGGVWYIHQQQEISYLPKEDNYCVTAEYSFNSKTEVRVHNYANKGEVNGPVYDSDVTLKYLGGICGRMTDKKEPAKLS